MKKLLAVISMLTFVGFSQSSLATPTCDPWITNQGGSCEYFSNPSNPFTGMRIDVYSAYQFCRYHGHTYDDLVEYTTYTSGVHSEATSFYNYTAPYWTVVATDDSVPILDTVLCATIPLS